MIAHQKGKKMKNKEGKSNNVEIHFAAHMHTHTDQYTKKQTQNKLSIPYITLVIPGYLQFVMQPKKDN